MAHIVDWPVLDERRSGALAQLGVAHKQVDLPAIFLVVDDASVLAGFDGERSATMLANTNKLVDSDRDLKQRGRTGHWVRLETAIRTFMKQLLEWPIARVEVPPL